MSPRPHIALNAHLLSGEGSYRAAGIHGYIYNTLLWIPEAAPHMDFTVFAGTGRVPAQPRLNIRRTSLATDRPLARILWEQLLAPIALGELKPSLFHGMAFAVPLLWRGLSVVTVYDMSFIRYPERLTRGRRLYLTLITRLSVRKSARVIAISEYGKGEIVALLHIPASRVDVATPGVSQAFRPQSRQAVEGFRAKLGLPERFILYVGTLEPRKNLDTLVSAFARLPQRGKVKLVLVGARGWQIDPLFKLIERLDVGDDVIMAGYADADTLPLWYSSAELFVYPSLYEGFGLPVLEAMACGTPVMVANATSLPEIVGPDAGCLEPTDVTHWTNAMASLLDDRLARDELSARGRERAAQFTWEQTARQTVRAYDTVL